MYRIQITLYYVLYYTHTQTYYIHPIFWNTWITCGKAVILWNKTRLLGKYYTKVAHLGIKYPRAIYEILTRYRHDGWLCLWVIQL